MEKNRYPEWTNMFRWKSMLPLVGSLLLYGVFVVVDALVNVIITNRHNGMIITSTDFFNDLVFRVSTEEMIERSIVFFIAVFLGLVLSYLLYRYQWQSRVLLQSNARFRAYIEHSPIAVFVADAKGRYQEVNDAACHMLGYSREELLARSIEDLQDPEFKDVGHDHFVRLLHDGQSAGEVVLLRKDGQRLYLSIDAAALPNGKYIGYCSDITEHHFMIEELKQKECELRTLFDHMGSCIAVYHVLDDGTRFVFKDINQMGCELGYLKREEVIGKDVIDVFPAIQESGLYAFFKKVWKSRQPGKFPLFQYEDDRITEWVENYVYVLPNGDLVAIYQDVTQQKVMQQTLAGMEERYHALYSAMHELVVIHELVYDDGNVVNYRIVDVNTAFENALGLTREDVISRLATEVYDVDKAPYLMEYSQVVQTKEVYHFEPYFKAMDKYFSISVVPIGENGFATISYDVTQRVKMEQELKKMYRDMEKRVQERTAELRSIVKAMAGREIRMSELKDVIRTLRQQLIDAGIHPAIDDPLISSTKE